MEIIDATNIYPWATKDFCLKIRKDPNKAVRSILNVNPSPYQDEIIWAVFNNKQTACRSGHAIGKTEIGAVLVPLWIMSHPYGGVLITGADWKAITNKLVRAVKRVYTQAKLKAKFGIVDKPLTTHWDISKGTGEWGYSCISTNNPESAAGYHTQGGTLVLSDESSGLGEEMDKALASNLSAEYDAALMMGNPLHGSGAFHDAFFGDTADDFYQIHVSSLDSPNIVWHMICVALNRKEITLDDLADHAAVAKVLKRRKDVVKYVVDDRMDLLREMSDTPLKAFKERPEIIPGLASEDWHRMMKLRWKGPEYDARILGEFPDQAEDEIIARSTLRACAQMEILPVEQVIGPIIGSVDIARSPTGDETIWYIRSDNKKRDQVLHRKAVRGWTGEQITYHSIELTRRFHVERWYVDDTGLAGVADTMVDNDMKGIVPVNYARKAKDSLRYANARAQMYSSFASNLCRLAIPEEIVKILLAQAGIKKRYQAQSGRLIIEDKKEYRKRTGRSPDDIDALAQSYYDYVGDPLFPSISVMHRNPLKAVVGKYMDEWRLNLGNRPHELTKPGDLARAVWFSRHNRMACIWVHINEEGTWTVWDAIRQDARYGVREFARKIHDRSIDQFDHPHEYHWNMASGPGAQMMNKERDWLDRLTDELRRLDADAASPTMVDASDLSGMAGMEEIDRLLKGTLIRFPDLEYWSERKDELARLQASPEIYGEQITICNAEVFDELNVARFKAAPMGVDEAMTQSEEAVDGGGPYVLCLRQLALAAAGFLTV